MQAAEWVEGRWSGARAIQLQPPSGMVVVAEEELLEVEGAEPHPDSCSSSSMSSPTRKLCVLGVWVCVAVWHWLPWVGQSHVENQKRSCRPQGGVRGAWTAPLLPG